MTLIILSIYALCGISAAFMALGAAYEAEARQNNRRNHAEGKVLQRIQRNHVGAEALQRNQRNYAEAEAAGLKLAGYAENVKSGNSENRHGQSEGNQPGTRLAYGRPGSQGYGRAAGSLQTAGIPRAYSDPRLRLFGHRRRHTRGNSFKAEGKEPVRVS